VIKIGIVGGTGYTGVELLRILALHPQAKVQTITSRADAGTSVSQMFPSLRGYFDLKFSHPDDAQLDQCDLVFLLRRTASRCNKPALCLMLASE